MKNTSYTTLQKKYAGKLVAFNEKQGKVVASGNTVQEIEKILKKKGIDPATCTFLGPIEQYKQIICPGYTLFCRTCTICINIRFSVFLRIDTECKIGKCNQI